MARRAAPHVTVLLISPDSSAEIAESLMSAAPPPVGGREHLDPRLTGLVGRIQGLLAEK
ncbi:hypothetical protein Aph01nite_11980 [Acrocarpospora phusangensis]|uniref:Uncharacterized protein n=1 Tax=Acrocarpospora phusangensis TaxID=1070424 RepID=A0A919Q8M7_9ACTN|nr:hypothetical protein [Acrocarpospora phusangensis]GIH22888.1 hypothetical protein Aph01nite_11980 [Acrocarpospora phusangensis]